MERWWQNGGKNTAKFESRFGKIGVSGRFDLGIWAGLLVCTEKRWQNGGRCTENWR